MSITSEISRLQTAKANIKTSIEGKGVAVPTATKLDGYPALIGTIQTGAGFDLLGMQYVQSHAPQDLGLPDYLEGGPPYELGEYFIDRGALESPTNALLIILQDSYGDAPPLFFWSWSQDLVASPAATVIPGDGVNPFNSEDGVALAATVLEDAILICSYFGGGFEILEIHEFG